MIRPQVARVSRRGSAGAANLLQAAEIEQGFLDGETLAVDDGANGHGEIFRQGALVVPERVFLAGLALGQNRRVIIGCDVRGDSSRVLLPIAALAGGGFAADFPDIGGEFVGKNRPLPRNTGESTPQILPVHSLRRFAEAFFAVATDRNEIVHRILHVTHTEENARGGPLLGGERER